MRAKLTANSRRDRSAGCAKRAAFCFVTTNRARGCRAHPSFGSDEFNDHHFHYGYFLYAAGILTQNDPELAEKFAPVMNLLAADIGSNANNGAFPDRRVFDAYAGHSWASGTSPFADGNNQESSSEAITAWTGLALWAKASGNAGLQTEATWMLSSEAQSGLAYWTNFDRSEPVYSGYGHQIVSLNWGGKRDYATWFSPEPAAMLGILVIPMSPASTYLGGDAERIKANVAEATGGKFDQKFGDYLLMSPRWRATPNEDRTGDCAQARANWIDAEHPRLLWPGSHRIASSYGSSWLIMPVGLSVPIGGTEGPSQMPLDRARCQSGCLLRFREGTGRRCCRHLDRALSFSAADGAGPHSNAARPPGPRRRSEQQAGLAEFTVGFLAPRPGRAPSGHQLVGAAGKCYFPPRLPVGPPMASVVTPLK